MIKEIKQVDKSVPMKYVLELDICQEAPRPQAELPDCWHKLA